MQIRNLLENLPLDSTTELFENLLQNNSIRIERIISEGHSTPPGEWFDQDSDEWVILLQGSAGLLFKEEGANVTMKPGDYVYIAAHRIHRVEWTDRSRKTIWLAIHFKNEGGGDA